MRCAAGMEIVIEVTAVTHVSSAPGYFKTRQPRSALTITR
jgi:hypothetical protein